MSLSISLFEQYAKLRLSWNLPTNNSSPLFISPKNKPIRYDSWCARFKEIIIQSKLSTNLFKPHSLRKTGATILYLIGLKPEQIKSLGRWKSIAWMTYVQPNPLDSAIEATHLLSTI